MAKSAAKLMQETTQAPPPEEVKIRVCLRTDNGYEYNMVLAESALQGLLDPDVADVFMEVVPPRDVPSVKHQFIHSSRIKEIDVFDAFSMNTPVDTMKRSG